MLRWDQLILALTLLEYTFQNISGLTIMLGLFLLEDVGPVPEFPEGVQELLGGFDTAPESVIVGLNLLNGRVMNRLRVWDPVCRTRQESVLSEFILFWRGWPRPLLA